MDQFPIIELLKNPVMRDIFPDHKTPEILMINRNKQYTPERQFYIVLGMFYTILTFLRLKINKNIGFSRNSSANGYKGIGYML